MMKLFPKKFKNFAAPPPHKKELLNFKIMIIRGKLFQNKNSKFGPPPL